MKHNGAFPARKKNCRGQSLIEFAFVTVSLVTLLFGVVEMCRLVLVYTTLANAARVGVRYAIVHGTNNSVTCSDIATVVNGFLGAATVQTGTGCTTSAPPCAAGAACVKVTPQTPGAPGTKVTVTVSYQYNPFTPYFPVNLNLSSSSEGVVVF